MANEEKMSDGTLKRQAEVVVTISEPHRDNPTVDKHSIGNLFHIIPMHLWIFVAMFVVMKGFIANPYVLLLVGFIIVFWQSMLYQYGEQQVFLRKVMHKFVFMGMCIFSMMIINEAGFYIILKHAFENGRNIDLYHIRLFGGIGLIVMLLIHLSMKSKHDVHY